MALKIRYVEEHQGGQRYRRRVPPALRDKIGCASWYKTFPPRTPLAVIEREAKSLAAEHDAAIARAKGQEVTAQIQEQEAIAQRLFADDKADAYEVLGYSMSQGIMSDKDRYFINAMQNDGKYQPETLSITAALKQDAEKYGQDRDERPFKYAVESFVKAVADKDITAITRADAAKWIASQNRLAPATIERRLGTLRALVNRAYLDLEIDRRNPFEKHKIVGGSGAASDRLPFNKAMLDKIDSFLASNKRLGHETVNILRMMKCTGAGPGEIGGLAVADVSLDSEVPYIWIRKNALRGVKADVRDRQIPLIGTALDAAREALKRARGRSSRKSADDIPLFTSFRLDRGADSISAKLNKCIRSSGVPKSPRLTAYSYRHTLKEALRSAGVADHIQRRLLGHAGHGVADRYGSPRARLSEAKTALAAAMKCLGDIDDAIYSEAERMK